MRLEECRGRILMHYQQCMSRVQHKLREVDVERVSRVLQH